ncbi:hypothetical protein IQ266_17275 [filamentous cyanobacterium LEGE 11480]|uniref:Contractile injection system tube protein N-terminal domain-containing protein n=2 Tax=Romeriopsis TaxID=2992131 RepID=A0A928Z4Y1_9CYAN|nr:hypothetical protein [Romeriopsis navalis LEGE 11480]
MPAPEEHNVDAIEFMFNPTELKFSRSINIEQAEGSTTNKGKNKTSFKHPNPYQLSIGNIVLDVYERSGSEQDVLKYLKPFTEAVKYTEHGKKSGGKRPPIYIFTWGERKYMRCFVKSLNFRLTMFLPDGTPVRAIVDLSLEEVDDPRPQAKQGTPKVGKQQRSDSKSLFLSG